jgi:hypothetical protein
MEKGGYEIYFSCGSTGDQSGVIEISPELVEQLCGDPKVEMVGQAT